MSKPWTSFQDEREGFSHWDASLLVQELALQCGYAIHAFRELESACQSRQTFRAYYQLQAFLAASGAISRMLWPSPRFVFRPSALATSLAERRRTSARLLREAVGVAGLEPLRDRNLRNAITHYDEWLTEFIVERHSVYPDLMMSEDEPGIPPGGRLRHLDPRTLILSLRGEALWLQGVHNAIRHLTARLDAGNWQLVIGGDEIADSW